jgi:hypothetical protein
MASTTVSSSEKKEKTGRRGQGFSQAEFHLVDSIEQIRPVENTDWEQVLIEHKKLWPNKN